MTTPQIFGEFTAGLSEINSLDVDRAISTSRGDELKRTTSSVYDMAATGSSKGDIWNWGMYSEEIAREIDALIPGFDQFDTDGISEQLYYLALRGASIPLDGFAGKTVVEVGCGMGEGLNFVSRLIRPDALVGLDISQRAIDRANATLSRGEALRYIQGDAEELPFDDGSVDLLINIESSHTYPNLNRFFEEVARVLKPGGCLSHIDLFTAARYELMAALKKQSSALEWIDERDISEEVRAGIKRRLEPGSHFHKVFEEKKINPLLRGIMEHSRSVMFGAVFAGYEDSGYIKLLRRLKVLPTGGHMPVESYRHHVAMKPLA
jgi:ubiquinone/menaquinone biosynthesis C-methylase UbiE